LKEKLNCRQGVKMRLLVALICLAIFSSAAWAASPAAWAAFRKEVHEKCIGAAGEYATDIKAEFDGIGTEAYGVAYLQGTSKRTKKEVSFVCIFDKRTKVVEVVQVFGSPPNKELVERCRLPWSSGASGFDKYMRDCFAGKVQATTSKPSSQGQLSKANAADPEYKALFFNGKPFTVDMTNVGVFKMTFRPDGTMRRESPPGKEPAQEGRWKFVDGGYCATLGDGPEFCGTLTKLGDGRWQDTIIRRGEVTSIWFVERPTIAAAQSGNQVAPKARGPATQAAAVIDDWKSIFLTGREFISTVAGGVGGGLQFKLVYTPDGKRTFEPIIPNASKGSATWKIVKEQLCISGSGGEQCYTLVRKDKENWSVRQGQQEVVIWTEPGAIAKAGSATPANVPTTDFAFTPNYNVTVSVCPGCSGQPTQHKTFTSMDFVSRLTGIRGRVLCYGSTGQRPAVQFNIVDDAASVRLFIQDNLLLATLDGLKMASYNECNKALKSGALGDGLGAKVTTIPEFFYAYAGRGQYEGFMATASLTGPWAITGNLAKEQEQRRIAAVRAEEEAAREQQRRMQAKSELNTKYNIQNWVNGGQLAVNPFVYKGQVVAMLARFDRMISENEGMFVDGGNAFMMSKLPSTLFQGNAYVVAIGRVTGNRTVKTPFGGEANIPALEFLGVYDCSNNACQGF
jgi:hypothetical protein